MASLPEYRPRFAGSHLLHENLDSDEGTHGLRDEASHKGASGDIRAIVSGLNRQISTLAIHLSDIQGNAETITAESTEGRHAAEELKLSTAVFTEQSNALTTEMKKIASTISEAATGIDDTSETIRISLAKTQQLTTAVRDASELLANLQVSLNEAATISNEIRAIAMQTNMLAINAAIEAARAGEAGKGFAVVAHEVRLLAKKTQSATQEIDKSLDQVTSSAQVLIKQGESNIKVAAEVYQDTHAIIDMTTQAADTLHRIKQQSGEVIAITENHEQAFHGLHGVINHVSNALIRTSGEIGEASDSLTELSDVAEAILLTIARTEVPTEDTTIIATSRDTARQIAALFEASIDRGDISLTDLFDDHYQVIPNTNPVQHMARHTVFTDTVLPALQEPLLDHDPRIVFACVCDRNGYIATHNRKFSLPQGPDPVWNTANCRNRRIFADRVGLAAGRSRAPFLLQIYRRDMGGGRFTLMKHVSCPISVKGQHWGALRCAFAADSGG